jgi:hypothetical protein
LLVSTSKHQPSREESLGIYLRAATYLKDSCEAPERREGIWVSERSRADIRVLTPYTLHLTPSIAQITNNPANLPLSYTFDRDMISDYHKPTQTHNMDWPTDYAACLTLNASLFVCLKNARGSRPGQRPRYSQEISQVSLLGDCHSSCLHGLWGPWPCDCHPRLSGRSRTWPAQTL